MLRKELDMELMGEALGEMFVMCQHCPQRRQSQVIDGLVSLVPYIRGLDDFFTYRKRVAETLEHVTLLSKAEPGQN